MPEYHDDLLLRDSFAQFAVNAGRVAPAPDRGEVRAIARRRRQIQVGAIAIVTAILVAIPVTGYALLSRTGPTATPLRPPGPSLSASGPTVQRSPISLDDLAHATVDLPAWPSGVIPGCPSGKFQFRGTSTHLATAQGDLTVLLGRSVYVDVDHDGSAETVVVISCVIQGGTSQVVAFGRAAGGAIVTVGQVVGSGDGLIRDVLDVRADPGGVVGVQVADVGSIDGSDVFAVVEEQWRGYGWTGTKFTQASGPTAFPVNPNVADLAVTATDLHLAIGPDGLRRGTVVVTVRNNGAGRPAHVALRLRTGDSLTARTPAGATCTLAADPPAGMREYSCLVTTPVASQSVTLAFGYTTAGGGPQPPGEVDVVGQQPNNMNSIDRVLDNNHVAFPVFVDS